MAKWLTRSVAARIFPGSNPGPHFFDKMKKAIIVHGWGGKPEHGWYLWLKKKMEKKGFIVDVPEMPNTDEPEIKAWTGKLSEVAETIDEETILIGHSIGCQAILRWLERLTQEAKVEKCIFIAPWMHLDETTIEEEGQEAVAIAKLWIETPIDFLKVRVHCDKFICIFSDNDPYVPLSDIKLFEEELGAETLLLNNRGHFDTDSGIKDLPKIMDFILIRIQ